MPWKVKTCYVINNCPAWYLEPTTIITYLIFTSYKVIRYIGRRMIKMWYLICCVINKSKRWKMNLNLHSFLLCLFSTIFVYIEEIIYSYVTTSYLIKGTVHRYDWNLLTRIVNTTCIFLVEYNCSICISLVSNRHVIEIYSGSTCCLIRDWELIFIMY